MQNKAEQPSTVTAVQILLLNYQPNHKSNKNSQSNGVSNQLMFAQRRKTGDDKGNEREKEKRPKRNLDHINCNYCGGKVHYTGNDEFPTQTKFKEDVESFRKTKQEKYSNKSPGVGDQKLLVNVKDASCGLMMGAPTKKWGEPQFPGLMFCKTSTQELLQTEPNNNNVKKGNASIMHVDYTILDAATEARSNENWCLIDNHLACNAFINIK